MTRSSVRPAELRKAEWYEFDLDKAEWHISAARMKMRVKHLVQLSEAAIAILREREHLTNRPIALKLDAPRYVFPGTRLRERFLSENAIPAALRRMGYTKEEMSGHGKRLSCGTV